MSGRRSRNKGAVGEREVAMTLRSHGFDATRNARNGLSTEDIAHDIPGVHLEVKRAETLAIPKWLRQAESDAPDGMTPVLVFRQSHQPWRAVVPLEFLLQLLRPTGSVVLPNDNDTDTSTNPPGPDDYSSSPTAPS